MNDVKSPINKVNSETNPTPEKGPLSFISGSLTSFLLFIFFYFISNKIAIYFSLHKPSNSSEIGITTVCNGEIQNGNFPA